MVETIIALRIPASKGKGWPREELFSIERERVISFVDVEAQRVIFVVATASGERPSTSEGHDYGECQHSECHYKK